jgi:hypothetical protein
VSSIVWTHSSLILKLFPAVSLFSIISCSMNIFLATLEEYQNDWEGDNFIRRVGEILTSSLRHFQVDHPNLADVILFLESNRFKSQHDFSCFQKTSLLQQFPHKCFALNYADSPVAFLPGLYVCLPRQSYDPGWTRAIPYPWASPNKELATFNPQLDHPEFKLSFRGSISHPIRQKVLDLMTVHHELGPSSQIQRWFNHTSDEQLAYLQEISNSQFVLCPRGIGTSSYRLYEVLSLGRVPIIISDDWVPPEGVDWNSCSIRIAEGRVGELPSIIDHFISRWPEMSVAAANVWHSCFRESVLADFLFDQLESLFFSRVPLNDWSYLEDRWRSYSFRRQNQWDLKSKGKRFVSRLRKAN